MRLQGKTAIVTGAASGFGRGIAETFAREGAKVVVSDVNAQGAEEVAAGIGEGAKAVAADVTKREDLAACLAAAQELGGIDILVNNAGMTHRNQSMLTVEEDEFDRMNAVNMKSIYLAAQVVVPAMIDAGGGVVINTASTAGLRPRPGLTWYNATKGWVNIATKSMAVELAPQNVRVNALCPVAGETAMLGLFMGEDTPEKRAAFKATVPLGRLSVPQDIANAALWLASDEAEFITGVLLEVDGGRCI